ncbi:hypothetical protein [Brevundimonas sp.]|uniref:hypothetical protein n=1 Tax=Brevundimonas sp. TaxID=1871086 RepID=UPI002623E0D8|nr:hypothetical protein [Brevundimonas sp.]
MKAWKLTDEMFAPALIAGDIMVCSLEYYSDLEERTGDRWIGDRLETGGEVFVGHYNNKTSPKPVIDRLSKLFSGDGTIEAHGLRLKSEAPHSHIFCATVGDIDAQEASFTYSASVEITDFEGLAKAIYDKGVLRDAQDVKVSDIFSKCEFGKVAYEEKVVTIESGLDATSSPFVKPTLYAQQEEVRIVLEAREPLIHDRQFIRIPDPERYFAPHYRKRVGTPPHTETPLLEEIRTLVGELKAFDDAFNVRHELALKEYSTTIKLLKVELGTLDSPEFYARKRALFEPVDVAFMKHHEAMRTRFRTRIMNLAWRARIELGLRVRGGAVLFDESTLEALLARHDLNAEQGPSMAHLRETTYFYGRRPPVPAAWIGSPLWDTMWP